MVYSLAKKESTGRPVSVPAAYSRLSAREKQDPFHALAAAGTSGSGQCVFL